MNATLTSSIKIPQHLSAALLTEYLIKNVSCVPSSKSSRCCSALNCRTHRLHRTLPPRHFSTHAWQLAEFIEWCFFFFEKKKETTVRGHVFCPSPLHQLGICSCPSHCIVRQIDAGFHTQQAVHCSDLCKKVSGCLMSVRSGFVDVRFINCVVRFSSVLRGRSTASVSKASLVNDQFLLVTFSAVRNVPQKPS